MFPRQLEANGRQWSHPGEDSRTRWLTNTGSQRNSAHVQLYMTSTTTAFLTSLWSPLLQPIQRYDLYCYSIYNVTLISRYSINYVTISTVTASNTPLWSLLLHLLHHYDLYGSSIYNINMISIATTSLTSLWLYCYSIYHATMHSIATAVITSLWSLWLQHLLRNYDRSYYSIYYVTMISIVTASITSL